MTTEGIEQKEHKATTTLVYLISNIDEDVFLDLNIDSLSTALKEFLQALLNAELEKTNGIAKYFLKGIVTCFLSNVDFKSVVLQVINNLSKEDISKEDICQYSP